MKWRSAGRAWLRAPPSRNHQMSRSAIAVSCLAAAVVGWLGTPGLAQQPRPPLPLEPLGTAGQAIFAAFEGWGPHKTGEIVLLLGYFNRNAAAVDIPIGPDNRIEPGGPDLGQPTHFEPGRQWGVFTIPVASDFGTRKLTWTINANGQQTSVSFWVNRAYRLDFFRHAANGNEPAAIRFAKDGPPLTGPPLGIAATLSGRVGERVPLRAWVSDAPLQMPDLEAELTARNRPPPGSDAIAVIGPLVVGGARARTAGAGRDSPAQPDITVNWKKHRGTGEVRFAAPRIPLITKGDSGLVLEAATTATFSAPGGYILRAQVNDDSGDGGGGLQCCWTNALVSVRVH